MDERVMALEQTVAQLQKDLAAANEALATMTSERDDYKEQVKGAEAILAGIAGEMSVAKREGYV